MRRYLLDSNAVSDFVNDRYGVRQRAFAARQAGGRLGTCTPAVGELLYGIEKSATRAANLPPMQAGLRQFTIWLYDRPAAEEYGRLMAELMRLGRPSGEIDVQIAAVARVLGNCTVVSCDTDMLAIPGLAVEDWRS